jgi:hypothetical protein
MRIAFLGWGSLIWNPRGLRIRAGWQDDGPDLPIEFARISSDGRLTLVICQESEWRHVAHVQTLWAYACHTSVGAARCNLRQRERTPRMHSIGFLLTSSPDDKGSRILTDEQLGHMREWAAGKGLDAVVWTDLPSNWDGPPKQYRDKVQQPFNRENVIAYLRSLRGETQRKAERYIRFAPKQVDTPIRREIGNTLGWTCLK